MLTGKLGKADETQNEGWMFPGCILQIFLRFLLVCVFANREYPENNKS